MRIDLKKLMKLQVQTKSGKELGHVRDIVLETEGQNILQYEAGNLLGRKYLISREQVVSIDEKKMVVEDNVVREIGKEERGKRKVAIEPEGVMMREAGN